MALMNERHRRRSIRLRGYDYREAGAYFVTICTANRECFFGEIVDEAMQLNRLGEIVQDEWHRTSILRPQVSLDAFVVMPNHIHGIISFDAQEEGKARLAPTTARFVYPIAESLPSVLGAFKSACTKRINLARQTPGHPLWQRNYYEHVVRSESELARVREYIATNPARWQEDSENPNQIGNPQDDVALQKIFDERVV